MPDSIEVFSEIRQIRDRMEAIEHTQELLVRAEGDKILPMIWQAMDADETLARVYLLVNGTRTQNEIAAALKAAGVGANHEATVSRKLDRLRDLDLVELARQTKGGKVYRRTNVDRILRVGKKLERRLAEASQPTNGTGRDR